MNKAYEKTWQELLAYEGEVLGYLKRAVEDGELARDLFQEVYFQALLNLPQLKPERSLKNWLFTVARNKVINYFRDVGRRRKAPLTEQMSQSENLDTPDHEAIEFALNALPERQRRIFLLREIEGLNYKELSETFGLSTSAVTSLLNRARRNFKKNFQLFFLPKWLQDEAHQLPIDDLLRFVKPEFTDRPVLNHLINRSQKYFSALRLQWDQVRQQFFSLQDLQQLLQQLPDLKTKTVLDAGCATGMVAIHCALKAHKVVALDLNDKFVALLAQTKKILHLQNLSVVRADLRKLPLGATTIDLIFTVLVLHHLPRPQGWFENAARVLKKRGFLVVVEFERHNNKQLADTMHDIWLGFNPSTLKNWAKHNGLHCLNTQGWISKSGVAVRWYIFQKNS